MDFSNTTQLPASLQPVVTYRNFSAGQTLFRQQEAATTIYAVQSGVIQLLHYTKDGHTTNYYRVRAGEVCLETVLFLNTYPCEAIVEEQARILACSKVAFLASLEADFSFATAFMKQMADRLHLNQVMLESRSIRSARERVLHHLRSLYPTQNTIVLSYPLKDLAADLGLTPEVLSRTLTQLEKDGKIARDKRKIIISD